MSERVLLVLFPGAVAYEVVSVAAVLCPPCALQVITPEGEDHVDETGLVLRAQASFAEAERAQGEEGAAAVVVAGGNLESILGNEPLGRLLRSIHDRGGLTAAICAGPLALAQAGVLRGHAYVQAGFYPASMQSIWDGAEERRDPVVLSGNVITALPEAHIDFAIAIGQRLGVFADDAEAEVRRNYLKGRFDRDWSKSGPVPGC